MWDPYAEFETAVLPNGLTVHVAYWPGRSWVAAGFLVHSGDRLDNVGLEGTAHFVEHMVSRNCSVSYQDIKNTFKKVGGSLELGATSYNATRYRFFAPIEGGFLSHAFNLFGEMLLLSRLENFIEVQRQVILAEYQRKYPLEVEAELEWRMRKNLYAGTWLSRSITPLGHPSSIKAISEEDIQRYYDANYTPKNMEIVCVGGLSLSDILKLLETTPFSLDKDGELTPSLDPFQTFPPPRENRYVFEYSKHVMVEKPKESGSYISWVVFPGIINYFKLGILEEMLDQVLFEEVREHHGWSYNAYTDRATYGEFHEFYLKCEALAPQSLDMIEEVVESCIASIGERKSLFDDIITRRINSCLMLDITAQGLCGGALIDLSNRRRIVTYEEYINDLKALRFEDLSEVLELMVPSRRFTILVTP